jgi:SOS-response transcriptional repressor LexA
MNALAPVRSGLTPRQLECFKIIEAHIATTGTAPTYLQIARALGLNSKSPVNRLVIALQARGWITYQPYINCSIAIVPETAVRTYTLPPSVEAKLLQHCCATNESPLDVLADAVALFFDEAEGSVAA